MGQASKLPLTAAQRSMRAGIAGFARSSQQEADVAQDARAALKRRFENAVDPDGVLPEDERERRGHAALRAHMLRMALKSSRVRQARKGREAASADA